MRIIPYLRVSELDGAMRSFLPLGEDEIGRAHV